MKFRSIKNPATEGKIKLDDAVRVNRALAKQPVKSKPVRDWSLIVDRSKPESANGQILANQLNFLIGKGLASEGSALPSERELANTLKVSRNVIRGAYEQLMRAGKIESNAKKGFVVCSSTKEKKDSTARATKSKLYVNRSGSKRSAKSNRKKSAAAA